MGSSNMFGAAISANDPTLAQTALTTGEHMAPQHPPPGCGAEKILAITLSHLNVAAASVTTVPERIAAQRARSSEANSNAASPPSVLPFRSPCID